VSKAVRHDPPQVREVDFTTRANQGVVVRNQDPKRVYRLVAMNQSAIQTYRLRGFKDEVRRADGPYIYEEGVDESEGPIQYMGHVLMSAPRDLIEKEERDGNVEIGAQGTKEFDALEKRIVRSIGIDPMRGIMGRDGVESVSIKPMTDEAI